MLSRATPPWPTRRNRRCPNPSWAALAIVVSLGAAFFAQGGELADDYAKAGAHQPGTTAGESLTDHGITEFGIERTMCFGRCPVYTFIVVSDGTFRYKGEKFVERMGDFTGRISPNDFNRIAHLIRSSGYMDLADTYTRRITDLPTIYTTVVMNGRRKTISNYANAGPNKLWVIEQMIDRLMATAQWNGEKAKR